MAFAAIIDVLKRILEEPVPQNSHPILSLAKTDQEKRAMLNREDENSDAEDISHSAWSKSERTAWMRQSYKKPLAAAGVRAPRLNSGVPVEVVRANPIEAECEKAREKRLRRQATQGVVALFNAVKQHQAIVEKRLDDTGPLVFQKEKVITDMSTSDFLDRLSVGLTGAKHKAPSSTASKEIIPEAKPAPKRKLNEYPMTTFSVKIENG